MNPSQYLEHYGPVWETDPATGGFRVPERTLGWEFLAFCLDWLTNGEPEDSDGAGPFLPTPEQIRFALWWYALDEAGRFLYDEGVLQRLKGWGKDPFVTVLSLFEAFGECRFDKWDPNNPTRPVGKRQTLPLIQIAATTQEQTDSTLRLFRHYLSKKAMSHWRIEVNTEAVKADGIPIIKSVTSNPEALEGKSPTAVITNETHHWHTDIASEMWNVITRNAVKVAGGTSRVLSITNAYDPALDSIAQRTREAYEKQIAQFGSSRILYDTLEISPEAPLFVFKKGHDGRDAEEVDLDATKENLRALVDAARGDSKWHNLDRIIGEFLDTRYPPDLNRRFWLNTIVSSEDAWVDIRDIDKCTQASMNAAPLRGTDHVVMFFDGSKTDDSTVLVGCRITDGLLFEIASWHKPTKDKKNQTTKWLVPRNARDRARYDREGPNPYTNLETADEAVERAFKTWRVVGFFADPSHAREEVSNRSYWDEIIQEWHVKYRDKLKVWAGPRSGVKTDSITWDMSDPKKIEEFADAAERVSELIHRHELLLVDETGNIRSHMKNARVYKTREGRESIWKGKKTEKKIDLAVGCIGASHVRNIYLKQVGNNAAPAYNAYSRFA